MICQRCGQKTARVQFTEVVGAQKRQRQLCPACAQAEGLFVNLSSGETVESASALLPAASEHLDGPSNDPRLGLRCTRCECTLTQIRRSGRVGCPLCYDVFFEQLAPLLESVHGCSEHLPACEGGEEELTAELAAAIAREDFAEAARLRNVIRRRTIGDAGGAGA